jgi:hypothetical protein
MAFFRLQPVKRQHQCLDIPVVLSQPLRILLPGCQHRLVQTNVVLDSIGGQRDLVGVF